MGHAGSRLWARAPGSNGAAHVGRFAMCWLHGGACGVRCFPAGRVQTLAGRVGHWLGVGLQEAHAHACLYCLPIMSSCCHR